MDTWGARTLGLAALQGPGPGPKGSPGKEGLSGSRLCSPGQNWATLSPEGRRTCQKQGGYCAPPLTCIQCVGAQEELSPQSEQARWGVGWMRVLTALGEGGGGRQGVSCLGFSRSQCAVRGFPGHKPLLSKTWAPTLQECQRQRGACHPVDRKGLPEEGGVFGCPLGRAGRIREGSTVDASHAVRVIAKPRSLDAAAVLCMCVPMPCGHSHINYSSPVRWQVLSPFQGEETEVQRSLSLLCSCCRQDGPGFGELCWVGRLESFQGLCCPLVGS